MNTDPRKTFSWGKAFVFLAVAALLAGCASIALQVRGDVLAHGIVSGKSGSAASSGANVVTTAAGPDYPERPPADPVRLVIPAIGVDANIQDVGMSWSGVNIGVPTNFTDVGWYKYGPIPGMPGIAIIDGHLDGRNVPKAVFYNLGKLQPGNLIDVTDASGTTYTFQVTSSATYDYTASTTSLFADNTSTVSLDLITCAGDWITGKDSYNERVVVSAGLVTEK